MRQPANKLLVGSAILATGLVIALGAYLSMRSLTPSAKAADRPRSPNGGASRASADPLTAQTVELSASEIIQFEVQPALERVFTIQRDAVGTLDFNQEMSVAVFPPTPGKIISLFARAGDCLIQATALDTVDSPELV